MARNPRTSAFVRGGLLRGRIAELFNFFFSATTSARPSASPQVPGAIFKVLFPPAIARPSFPPPGVLQLMIASVMLGGRATLTSYIGRKRGSVFAQSALAFPCAIAWPWVLPSPARPAFCFCPLHAAPRAVPALLAPPPPAPASCAAFCTLSCASRCRPVPPSQPIPSIPCLNRPHSHIVHVLHFSAKTHFFLSQRGSAG